MIHLREVLIAAVFCVAAASLSIGKPADAERVCSALEAIVVPVYPPGAVVRKVQGDVVVGIAIGGDGSVTSATLISGDPSLAESARASVAQWHFGKGPLADKLPKDGEVAVRFVLTQGVISLTIEDKRLVVQVPSTVDDPTLLDAGRVLTFLGANRAQPGFPRDAPLANERVVVTVDARADGQVESTRTNSGSQSYRVLAEQAARAWTFRPIQMNGRRIRLRGEVVFNWRAA